MLLTRSKAPKPAGSGLAVAQFEKSEHLNDVISDLAHAGFDKRQIRVAFAMKVNQKMTASADKSSSHSLKDLGAVHSLRWQFRKNFEHDLHRSGTAQLTGKDKDPSASEPQPACSEVDLREALMAMHIPEERILLLNESLGTDGAFVFVDAGDRREEAESIMEQDSGTIRTDTATERSRNSDKY